MGATGFLAALVLLGGLIQDAQPQDAAARSAALLKRILGAQGAEPLGITPVAQPLGVAWKADGSLLIAAGEGGLLEFTDAAQRVTTKVAPQRVDLGPAWDGASVDAVAVAPDGQITLASASLGRLERRSAALEPRSVLALTTELLRGGCAMALADDGTLALALSRCGEVRFLQPSGALMGTLQSADGRVLRRPGAVASLGAGSWAVADTGNHRVILLHLDAAGPVVDRCFGERGPFAGQMCLPSGVAAIGDGLLVADRMNHRLARYDQSGKSGRAIGIHSVAPREGIGAIHYPEALAISGDMVALCEPFERRVQLFRLCEPSGQTIPPLPVKEGVSSHFGRGLAVGGVLLAAWEPEAEAVVVFDLRGALPVHVTTFGSPGTGLDRFGRIEALALRGTDILVADSTNARLALWRLEAAGVGEVKFDPFMARLVRTASLESLGLAQDEEIIDLASTPSGFLALTDAGQVLWLDAALAIVQRGRTTAAQPTAVCCLADGLTEGGVMAGVVDGGDGRVHFSTGATPLALSAGMKATRVTGITGFTREELFLSDSAGDRLAVIGAGVGRRWIGHTGGGDAEFFAPSDCAVLGDYLYVLDQGNHRLQRLKTSGEWDASFTLSKARLRPREAADAGSADASAATPTTASSAPPSATVLTEGIDLHSADGGFEVQLRIPVAIERGEPFDVEIAVKKSDGSTVSDDAVLLVDATMPHHGHGMNVRPRVERQGDGVWRASGLLWHMDGLWVLSVDLCQKGRCERAQVEAVLGARP